MILDRARARAGRQISPVGNSTTSRENDSDDGIARCPHTMHPLTHQLAVNRAGLDGEPRIVAHSGTISIVTPTGEVWQVFDSEGPGGHMRACPLNDDRVAARIFVRTGADTKVRIYRFGVDELRSTAPRPLLSQLERAIAGDEMAA